MPDDPIILDQYGRELTAPNTELARIRVRLPDGRIKLGQRSYFAKMDNLAKAMRRSHPDWHIDVLTGSDAE